jgi:methylated-DNA-[protein]-cysteine S-methyltransferase
MATTNRATDPVSTLLIFPSDLGWMGVVVAGDVVKRLTFGHCSAAAAKKAFDGKLLKHARRGKPNTRLVRRLQKYAAGYPDPLRDVPVDPGPMSDFRRRVLQQCRDIPYGTTLSYAELAAKAGSPRAARAAGNCMASNRIPLLIPCHRVVRSDGGLGSYSAPGGVVMKRRILALEAHGIGLELKKDSGQNTATCSPARDPPANSRHAYRGTPLL